MTRPSSRRRASFCRAAVRYRAPWVPSCHPRPRPRPPSGAPRRRPGAAAAAARPLGRPHPRPRLPAHPPTFPACAVGRRGPGATSRPHLLTAHARGFAHLARGHRDGGRTPAPPPPPQVFPPLTLRGTTSPCCPFGPAPEAYASRCSLPNRLARVLPGLEVSRGRTPATWRQVPSRCRTAGFPPLRLVALSALRSVRCRPARVARHGPGRSRAGRFVQLRKERDTSFLAEGEDQPLSRSLRSRLLQHKLPTPLADRRFVVSFRDLRPAGRLILSARKELETLIALIKWCPSWKFN